MKSSDNPKDKVTLRKSYKRVYKKCIVKAQKIMPDKTKKTRENLGFSVRYLFWSH